MSLQRWMERVSADDEYWWSLVRYDRCSAVLIGRCRQLSERPSEIQQTGRRWRHFTGRLGMWAGDVLFDGRRELPECRAFLAALEEIVKISNAATKGGSHNTGVAIFWHMLVSMEPVPWRPNEEERALMEKNRPVRQAVYESMARQVLLPDRDLQWSALYGLSKIDLDDQKIPFIASLAGKFFDHETEEYAQAAANSDLN